MPKLQAFIEKLSALKKNSFRTTQQTAFKKKPRDTLNPAGHRVIRAISASSDKTIRRQHNQTNAADCRSFAAISDCL
jgi:hypothetical protein